MTVRIGFHFYSFFKSIIMDLKKIFVCVLAAAAFGATNPTCSSCATLYLDSTRSDVSVGEKFTVSIILDEADGVAGATFTLAYPSDVFELAEDNPVATDFFNMFYDSRSEAEVKSVNPWAQNSETSGVLYLSGAYIGTGSETGGGGCCTGEQVMFNVTFQAKQNVVGGDYAIELQQTPLFGAGWGVDNDSDGVYDEEDGDEYELSPVLIKAYSKGTEQWDSEELEDDFEVILDAFGTSPSVLIQVEGVAGQASSLYFPHAASDETWETEIAVINTNPDAAITGDLAAYDQDGSAAGTIQDIELAPFARRQVVVGECDSFPAPESVSYLVFTSET